jgi:hypothetical protein
MMTNLGYISATVKGVMKMERMKLEIVFFVLGLAWATPALGQLEEFDFIYGGLEDAEKLLQAYLEPYANVLGSDLNAGWYNTARPHELGGFDVTVTVNMASAPAQLLTYDPSLLELNGDLVTGSTTLAPTIAGSMQNRPQLSYSRGITYPDGTTQDIEYARFTLPNGAGVDYFPLPMLQLTVGLPFGTDVSGRFVPMIQLVDYGEIGLWGVGGRHSLSQWIPVIKEIKLLDIALQGGYTKVTSSVNVDVEPLDVQDPDPPVADWDDQFVVQQVAGWTLNLIASQTLSVVTFYEGIGYVSSIVGLDLQGHFPVHTVIEEPGDDFGKTTYLIVEDPIAFTYENINNLRLNVGVRLKLSVLTLHYDFTYTLYATHSAGVGISFR